MADESHLSLAAGAVRLERLNKSFAGLQVVREVSLDIAPGEIVVLLGPSGCGKTTTLRMIAGLLAPDSGVVSIAGRPVNDVPVERRDVGLLFQNYALFPHLTVRGNVLFGLRTWRRRTPRARARALAAEALRLVRLEGFEDRYPAQLSGGQQQRVALARALVVEPAVLLLDEPLSALDRSLRVEMQAELRALVTRLNVTTILVTHDQEEAMTVADRIAVMKGGAIVQVGTPAELYERPATAFVAGFVGTTNFFAGTVACGPQGSAVLETGSGARLGLNGTTPPAGARAVVAVRPERIALRPGREDAARNAMAGRIETVTYKGTTIAVTVRLEDGALLYAAVLNEGGADRAFAAGQVVTASWSDVANVLLRE